MAGGRTLKAQTYPRPTGDGGHLGVTSNATATMSDRVTIHSFGRTGESAIWKLRLNADWDILAASGPGGASFVYGGIGWYPNMEATGDLRYVDSFRTDGLDTQGRPLDTIFEAWIPIVFGQEFELSFKLEGGNEAFSWGGGFGNAYFNAWNTVTFGGTVGVDLVGGGAVSGFDIVSASGEDWLNPVPVPEPGSMAAIGFGIVALLRRRRRLQTSLTGPIANRR